MSDIPKSLLQLIDGLDALKQLVQERAEIGSLDNLRREREEQCHKFLDESIGAVQRREEAQRQAANLITQAEATVKVATEKAADLITQAEARVGDMVASAAGLVANEKAEASAIRAIAQIDDQRARDELAKVRKETEAESDKLAKIRATIDKLAKG